MRLLEAIVGEVCKTIGTSIVTHMNQLGIMSMYDLYQDTNQTQEFLVRKR